MQRPETQIVCNMSQNPEVYISVFTLRFYLPPEKRNLTFLRILQSLANAFIIFIIMLDLPVLPLG